MKTKKTLVAIRLRRGRARELGQLTAILLGIGAVIAGVVGLKAIACKIEQPKRDVVECVRRR